MAISLENSIKIVSFWPHTRTYGCWLTITEKLLFFLKNRNSNNIDGFIGASGYLSNAMTKCFRPLHGGRSKVAAKRPASE
jgi:hypothetical protein